MGSAAAVLPNRMQNASTICACHVGVVDAPVSAQSCLSVQQPCDLPVRTLCGANRSFVSFHPRLCLADGSSKRPYALTDTMTHL